MQLSRLSFLRLRLRPSNLETRINTKKNTLAERCQQHSAKGSLQNTMETITLEHCRFSSLQNTISAITAERSPKTWHHGY